jgi:tRNA nucleotidyltransferase/poly(A) polymerase
VFSLPTESGPLDLKPMQRAGGIEAELEHCDFTLHALAYDPCARVLIDPHGGREDTTKGILRAVGDPAQRLAEDPLRALRAARLVATLGLLIDPALGRTLRSAAGALRRLPPIRVRGELQALLLGQNATQGLTLLRDSGIEARLAPGVGSDAAAVVGALPFDFDLRLAGWLRGTRAAKILRDLRHPRDRVARIERLLRLHPLDAHPRGTLDHKVRRLAWRDPNEVEDLMALRAAEISACNEGAEARARLDRLRVSVLRVKRAGRTLEQRNQLTLGGREIMEALGCDPGPTVGRALRFLTESVEEDPSRNDPDALRALLDKWRADN